MTQEIVTGWRRAFSHPSIYEAFQRLVGARSFQKMFVREYLRPRPGDRVLDVGCGPAHLLEFLPEVRYVGVDLSSSYIESAKRVFGSRGEFLVADARSLEAHDLGPFDLVTAVGLLHHLSDDGVVQFLRGLRDRMSGSESRLVTVDGCYIDKQSPIAAYLLSLDRGRHVRSPEGYAQLAAPVFERVQVTIRHDLLRIPFTHCILELFL